MNVITIAPTTIVLTLVLMCFDYCTVNKFELKLLPICFVLPPPPSSASKLERTEDPAQGPADQDVLIAASPANRAYPKP